MVIVLLKYVNAGPWLPVTVQIAWSDSFIRHLFGFFPRFFVCFWCCCCCQLNAVLNLMTLALFQGAEDNCNSEASILSLQWLFGMSWFLQMIKVVLCDCKCKAGCACVMLMPSYLIHSVLCCRHHLVNSWCCTAPKFKHSVLPLDHWCIGGKLNQTCCRAHWVTGN